MPNPGDINENGQVVDFPTHLKSTTHYNQSIYQMLCSHCLHHYGSNGCDCHIRRCPQCQDGQPGEPLPKQFSKKEVLERLQAFRNDREQCRQWRENVRVQSAAYDCQTRGFSPGALVEHEVFGRGIIVAIDGDNFGTGSRKAIVKFEDQTKTVIENFLTIVTGAHELS